MTTSDALTPEQIDELISRPTTVREIAEALGRCEHLVENEKSDLSFPSIRSHLLAPPPTIQDRENGIRFLITIHRALTRWLHAARNMEPGVVIEVRSNPFVTNSDIEAMQKRVGAGEYLQAAEIRAVLGLAESP